MLLQEIKAAVDAGRTVHWQNRGYTVIKDSLGQYLVKSQFGTQPCYWGLTWRDGVTLNGVPEQFYVALGDMTDAEILAYLADKVRGGATLKQAKAHLFARHGLKI